MPHDVAQAHLAVRQLAASIRQLRVALKLLDEGRSLDGSALDRDAPASKLLQKTPSGPEDGDCMLRDGGSGIVDPARDSAADLPRVASPRLDRLAHLALFGR